MKLIQTIVALCSIGGCLWLFSTLVPWWNETTGKAEIDEQAKLDAKACAPYTPVERGPSNVLYCQCEHNQSKPGKCR